MIEAIQAIKFEGKNFRWACDGDRSSSWQSPSCRVDASRVRRLCLNPHALPHIIFTNRELAEQSKKHGNDLFGWGKKNPAQYSNCLKSYNVRACVCWGGLMGGWLVGGWGVWLACDLGESFLYNHERQEAICYAREVPVWGETEEEDEDKCLSKEGKALLLSQVRCILWWWVWFHIEVECDDVCHQPPPRD